MRTMAKIRLRDPDKMAYKRGSWVLSFLGLLLLAPALFLLWMLVWNCAKGDPPPLGVAAKLSIPAAFMGLLGCLALVQYRIVIDRGTKMVTRWWGLFIPMKRVVTSLDSYDAVVVALQVSRGQGGERFYYPIALTGPSAQLHIDKTNNRDEARNDAEELAKFLTLRLIDRSTDTETIREAHTLDMSLRERIQDGALAAPELPPMPENTRSSHHAEGEVLTVEIPRPGLSARHFGALASMAVLWCVLLMFAVLALLSRKRPGDAVFNLIIFTPVLAPMLCLAIWLTRRVVHSAFKRTTVAVSPSSLDVTQTSLMKTERTAIPADELEELEVVTDIEGVHKGKVIGARSDRASVRFGVGLPEEELVWLHAAIARIVSV